MTRSPNKREHEVVAALALAPEQGWTLEEIAVLTDYPAASVSASIRFLRTEDGGGHLIETLYHPNSQRGHYRFHNVVLHDVP